MTRNPGDKVLDFVMLHLAIHDRPDEGGNCPDDDQLAESYDEAKRDMTALAGADLDLCLTLLADLARHFAGTLGQQAGRQAVEEVLNDWAGRGWAPRVHRSGAITPTVLAPASHRDSVPMPVVEKRWPAGSAPPF